MSKAPSHPTRADIHFMEPSFHSAPHESYSWLRKNAPVYWDATARTWRGLGAWGITRYKDIRKISTRQDLFSSTGGSRPDAPPVPSMINRDGAEHRARRETVRHRFTLSAVRRYEVYVRQAAVQLIERVKSRGGGDLVLDLAMPLPMMVIGKMMGLPAKDHERLLHWSDLIATGFINMPERFKKKVLTAAEEFGIYIEEWFERRSKQPEDDVLSDIVQAKILNRSLDIKDRYHEALLLLVGGDETTRHVLSGGLVALIDSPLQMKALKSDLSGVPIAVEEMLRWVTPVKTLSRDALIDIKMGGQKIKAGDKVILLFESGNLDESIFENAHEFNILRTPNRHLSFGGYGKHHCLGAQLARLEIRVMLEEILSRLPNIRRADQEPLKKRLGTFVLGYERVNILV